MNYSLKSHAREIKTYQSENDEIIINLIIEINFTSVPFVNGTDDN